MIRDNITIGLILAALLFAFALLGWLSIWWAVGFFVLDIVLRLPVMKDIPRRVMIYAVERSLRGRK